MTVTNNSYVSRWEISIGQGHLTLTMAVTQLNKGEWGGRRRLELDCSIKMKSEVVSETLSDGLPRLSEKHVTFLWATFCVENIDDAFIVVRSVKV